MGTTVKDLLPGIDFDAATLGTKQGGDDVFRAGPRADVVRVRQIAFPTTQGGRATYAVLVVKNIDESWALITDAATGRRGAG
ncbi:hypothetical protein NPS01_09780 [Nocardioides psychrotolerans]|uniref:Uncharacterized protein n=1 Tax=Nocardioides psychrotolerans TaxID=1005945 RepID=A0A1I3FU88_9ACTN|nr:hypothetical protein [Nocardioides psychrotolerans]GEP37315.1 hypothetical protein NPS01_09780 [Nocardioides psychrotolerans]SFI14828.1 hypothetical protein SAMN05216561_105158 [Nocardioides psychrotolerans]